MIAPKSFAFTVILGVFAALPALSVDISAPTLPLLPAALGTSQTVASLTLTLFMVGFALGQFGAGGLSDGHGRRRVLLAALCCFTVAGIACSISLSGEMLAFSRFIQGFGAGACAVISFAMVQDLFEGEAARAKRSYVAVIFAGVPMIAPALGSALICWFGWRSVHSILAVGGGLLLVITWSGIAESRLKSAVESGQPSRIVSRVWSDPKFAGIMLANALSYGSIFAYIAGSPVVIVGQMGLSTAVFAAVFASTAAALAAGAWTSGRLGRRGVAAPGLVSPSLLVSATAAVALAGVSLSGVTTGWILIPLLLVVLFTRGIISPNMQHLAIERQRQRAGAASAAVGLAQLLFGALASATVAFLLRSFGVTAVSVPMALFATAAWVAWRWMALDGDVAT